MTEHPLLMISDSSEPDEETKVGPIPNECTCGGTLYKGFGLTGGGYGPYAICDDCGAIYKEMIAAGDE